MNQYVIQRDLPGAGKLTEEQLADISTRSVEVLATMTGIEWVHSYVTTDRIYCVYFAENESLVLDQVGDSAGGGNRPGGFGGIDCARPAVPGNHPGFPGRSGTAGLRVGAAGRLKQRSCGLVCRLLELFAAGCSCMRWATLPMQL